MDIPDRDDDKGRRRELPPGLAIRARRTSDADGIAEMVNLPGYRFGTSRLPYHSPDEVRGWIEKTPSANLALVAVVADQIVGDGGLHRFSGRQLHVAGRLELTVYVDNAPAIHLYRRFGFEMEGTHRAFALRDGQYVNAHAMARIRPPSLPAAD
jgi:putative acetyltransferase